MGRTLQVSGDLGAIQGQGLPMNNQLLRTLNMSYV